MLKLPHTVRLKDAQQVLGTLIKAVQGSPAGAPLELDASELSDFDSAVLAVLLECQRQATASGRVLSLVGAPSKLSELARVYGLSELLWPDLATTAA